MAVTNEVPLVERLYHVVRLWGQWAEELGHAEFDADGFGREVVAKLTSGRTEYFLLVADGEVVGFIEATVDYDPAISQNVLFGERAYLVPEYRERGAFTQAFKVMETWALEEKGVKQAVIEVAAEADWLIRFYEEHGFEVTHLKMRRIERVQ